MISREIALLRHVEVLPRTAAPLTTLSGTEAAARHLRTLAGLFCDHELPKAAAMRLPPLNARLFYDGQPWRVYGHSLRVKDRVLTLATLLEDTALAGRLQAVPYWTEQMELAYMRTIFHCRAQHPAGATEAVLAILDAAQQLYTIDAPAKAVSAAKLAHAICRRHDEFAVHFTLSGIYALSGNDYLGAVPRLTQTEPASAVARRCG